jgi:hypothetical protein
MTELDNDGHGIPLKLYYKLQDGHTADAEVIARASLAFIAGVKELTYVIDPSARVSIGIQGYAPGSLWEDLLLLIKKGEREYEENPTRYGLALAALVWLLSPPLERIRENAWQPILEKYLPNASVEDVAEARRIIEIADGGKVALKQKQQFFREVGRDTGIIGVGANIDRENPAWIVPRSEFSSYGGQTTNISSEIDRTTVGMVRVTILSPVLEVSNRRWKFETSHGEFGAVIKDKEFLEKIVEGRTKVRMRGGVELDVELETKERLTDGVWIITERNVLRVVDIQEPESSRQASMFPR